MVRSEKDITQDVVDILNLDTTVDADKVTVHVDKDHVRLKGTVPSYADKIAAENAACCVAGVNSIDNDIEVKSRLPIPKDSEIKKSVTNFLKWNANVDMENIEIEVDKGIVTLEGSVPSYWEKVAAESEAQTSRGVIDIQNKLAVVPADNINDEIIGERIMDKIERNTWVDVDSVDVKVDNGTVVVSGRVPSWRQRNSVIDAAMFTTGVVDIEDRIHIAQT